MENDTLFYTQTLWFIYLIPDMYVHVRTCAYMYVSPFVLSFLAHSLSKGNLQQLQLRESKERQQIYDQQITYKYILLAGVPRKLK